MALATGLMIGPLTLKPLAMADSAAFWQHIEQNRAIYQDTIPFVSGTHTLGQLEQLLTANLAKQAQNEAQFYGLWHGTEMAGYLLVREINPQARWAEIGYMLGQQWHGQGIITKACQLLIDDLFDVSAMDKIALCCNDNNHASIAVAKRLGFTLEGTLRQYFVVNQVRRNMCCFGLLREEWQQS
ncbi:GNAT family N-acetyltransferase [Shewanella avicenniae]|uniref:GNAT family N-acetyltransferase n=1 Tax=Shewanella avicenniae TaxID=2814294 RepID=A0ABX7QPX8_9GAMM|nr:GNAT family protein [Shewanella avicenniae]QSX32768.1 GNAT family N-acetyltransferase [Shewanella avicenniae]